MIIQIYSITTPEEAKKLSDVGVDHIGVMVGKKTGTYTQDFETARKIFDSIRQPSKKVAFTKSSNLSELEEVCKETKPDILHISAFENITNKLLKTIKSEFPEIKLMKSIYIKDLSSIEEAKYFQKSVDYLLLDSQDTNSSFGATGKVNDWKIAKKIVATVKVPVILAGGIGVDNVVEAIRVVNPAGVDSMTKTNVENGKTKDVEKVSEFVKVVRGITNF